MRRSSRVFATAGAFAILVTPVAVLAGNPAQATPGPGTYGPGTWSFDPGNGTNAIQLAQTSTSTSTSTAYQAQVQEPINPDGSSIWSATRGVIPVQFTLQQATDTKTTTTTTAAIYPSLLDSESSGSPAYGALAFTPTTGTTVSSITNLTADFTWLAGNNHTGSMRWSIVTSAGTFYVYYGDTSTSFQSGTGGTGTNMTATGENRVDIGGPYVSWSDLTAADGSATVSRIDLVVDAGYAGTQTVQLSDVTIGTGAGTSEYVPGTVAGSSSSTDSSGPWSSTTTAPMYIDVVQGTATAPGTPDDTTYTGVGDSGGQFHIVNGMYKYNLSNASPPLGSAGTYFVYMNSSPTLALADRVPTVNAPNNVATFTLK